MQRIPYLDGWRGFAVMGVLCAHFVSAEYINFGRMGVEMFFILSGRLMAEILFARATDLPSFFARRFSRVYPALLVFSLTMLILNDSVDDGPTLVQFLTSITFTMNYAMRWVGAAPVMHHIWSLCIEEHMYVFLGCVAFMHRKRPPPLMPIFVALAGLGMLAGVIMTLRGGEYYSVYWLTHVRGASILVGVIAYLAFANGTPKPLAAPWVPVIFGFGGVLLQGNGIPDPLKYSLGTSLLAVSLITMQNAPKAVLRVLEHPLSLRIGLWSYSIYIWQQPFAKLNGDSFDKMLFLGAAIGAGVIGFYLIEQPSRRVLNRLIDAKPWNGFRTVGSVPNA